jgi:hypothetical protein
MDIKIQSILDLFEEIRLQKNDVVLYLGGRVDDDNLYPPEYAKYLNDSIERLQPDKIICHNPWYAKKYYDKEILTKNMKIDIILSQVYYYENPDTQLQVICRSDYENYHVYVKTLTNKNPNIIYTMYRCSPIGKSEKYISITDEDFGEGYDLNNVKYVEFFNRQYIPDELIDGSANEPVNATDGFAVIKHLLDSGFNNLNIIGFSGFGSEEDTTLFTKYSSSDPRFKDKKYFDLRTSEDRRMEADILQYWSNSSHLRNLENYSKLEEST